MIFLKDTVSVPQIAVCTDLYSVAVKMFVGIICSKVTVTVSRRRFLNSKGNLFGNNGNSAEASANGIDLVT